MHNQLSGDWNKMHEPSFLLDMIIYQLHKAEIHSDPANRASLWTF